MKLQKAAMFGLDARIALAIFGALSVISGAALYSAIQQAKVTSWVVKLQEISKAIEAYYLDTGVLPSVSQVNTSVMDITQLIENSDNVEGWQGPYISYDIVARDDGTNVPRLQADIGCSLPVTAPVKTGHTIIQLRKFSSSIVTGKFDYRIHIQCLKPDLAKAVALAFNGDETLTTDYKYKARFLTNGSEHYQLYLNVLIK